MTLGAHRCDVIMGFPQGDELVQSTNPYYRTAYALVFKPGSDLEGVTRWPTRVSKANDRHRGRHAAGDHHGGQRPDDAAKPYPLMVDTRFDSSAEAMIKDLTSGEIDAGMLWGPMAGYYAKQANPPLHVVPLVKEATGPRLVLSHRHGRAAADQEWKRLLNRLIQENQPEINKILLDYGVPLLDEKDTPISAETAEEAAMMWSLRAAIASS